MLASVLDTQEQVALVQTGEQILGATVRGKGLLALLEPGVAVPVRDPRLGEERVQVGGAAEEAAGPLEAADREVVAAGGVEGNGGGRERLREQVGEAEERCCLVGLGEDGEVQAGDVLLDGSARQGVGRAPDGAVEVVGLEQDDRLVVVAEPQRNALRRGQLHSGVGDAGKIHVAHNFARRGHARGRCGRSEFERQHELLRLDRGQQPVVDDHVERRRAERIGPEGADEERGGVAGRCVGAGELAQGQQRRTRARVDVEEGVGVELRAAPVVQGEGAVERNVERVGREFAGEPLGAFVREASGRGGLDDAGDNRGCDKAAVAVEDSTGGGGGGGGFWSKKEGSSISIVVAFIFFSIFVFIGIVVILLL